MSNMKIKFHQFILWRMVEAGIGLALIVSIQY